MARKVSISVLLLIAIFLINGCTTTSSGLKNPKHKDRIITNAAILVVGGDLDLGLKIEKYMITSLIEKDIQAVGITEQMQFIRNKDEDNEQRQQLLENGIKEIIYVKIGDLSQSDIAGYKLSGTTRNTYGNNTYSSGTMMPIRTFTRDMVISCQVDDLHLGDIIWKGSSRRHAQGLLFIGDDSMISNGMSGLIAELVNDRMI